jgi:hypothetical protein
MLPVSLPWMRKAGFWPRLFVFRMVRLKRVAIFIDSLAAL